MRKERLRRRAKLHTSFEVYLAVRRRWRTKKEAEDHRLEARISVRTGLKGEADHLSGHSLQDVGTSQIDDV